MNLKSKIREVPDFPKKGILFYDITTLLKDPKGLKSTIDEMYNLVKGKKIDKVVAIESRGFIFAVPLALKLGAGFVLVRKPGKLPAETISEAYTLEYGSNTLEMHKDAIEEGESVLIIDDLLATGGTMAAAINLVEKRGGEVKSVLCLVELTFLKGRDLLKGYDVQSLITYDK
ncbi:adenine phosphoribosyltransferase [Candidatus Woesearchaeota archaeon]|nr:adenine phosphoribosyltransferase [Candidatus Woesearchaeota archaeon]